jgi:hypothetical protein
LANPTHKQAAATIRLQRRALAGTSVGDKQSAAAGDADSVTRQQIANIGTANARLERDRHVAAGVAEVTRDPRAYGLTDEHVQRLHQLAKGGRLPKGLRSSVARIGAARLAAGATHAVAAHERARHGFRPGLEAVAGLKLGQASGILASATIDAAEKAREKLNAGSGGFEHGSLLNNASKDLLHFPYDIVNTGVQTGKAAVDLAQGRPKRAEALAKATALTLADTIRHPIRSASEHPLDAALTFAGGVGAIGRTAGAISRGAGAASRVLPEGGGAVGSALRAAGDTRRPDLVLEPGARGLRVSRSYSKNLLVSAEQKRRDRVDIRKGLGDRKGIQFRGSDRARQRHERAAVHEFQDLQQNLGRTEREEGRRAAQTATGARVQSRRQAREVRVEAVRRATIQELRRRGIAAHDGMSAAELARAAERAGVSMKVGRRSAREVTAAKRANLRQRAERSVPTKVALPRRPFSARGGAAFHLRPERELLVPAAKQLLGDVRSSPAEVVTALHGEIRRLEDAYAAARRGDGSGRAAPQPLARRRDARVRGRPPEGRPEGGGAAARADAARRAVPARGGALVAGARRGGHADRGADARRGVHGLRGVAVRRSGRAL